MIWLMTTTKLQAVIVRDLLVVAIDLVVVRVGLVVVAIDLVVEAVALIAGEAYLKKTKILERSKSLMIWLMTKTKLEAVIVRDLLVVVVGLVVVVVGLVVVAIVLIVVVLVAGQAYLKKTKKVEK